MITKTHNPDGQGTQPDGRPNLTSQLDGQQQETGKEIWRLKKEAKN